MSIDTQKLFTTDVITIPFGMRLKSAREARGLESKDVAGQLRLSEKMICMIEKETYPPDLPITFIRGYIRAYARLMEISDAEITKALEPIKPEVTFEENEQEMIESQPVTSSNYFMQFFTYLIFLTIISLVGVWWYSHPSDTQVTENKIVGFEEPANAAHNVELNKNKLATDNIPSAQSDIANLNTKKFNNNISSNNSIANFLVLNVTNFYPLQFFTYFILFILISVTMLRWRPNSSNGSKTDVEVSLKGLSDFNLSSKEILAETEIPISPILLNSSQQKNKRETKKTIRILTLFVIVSFLSLGGISWYYWALSNPTAFPSFPSSLVSNLPETEIANLPSSNKINNANEASPLIQKLPPTPLASENKLDNITSTEKALPNNKSKSMETSTPLQNAESSISSGKYTPVPQKHVTSKYKKKAQIASPPVDDEFAELDDDDN